MEEINNEAEIKFEETRRKLIAVLSKASKLRNNDNLSKVQHDIGIFIKTYKILKMKAMKIILLVSTYLIIVNYTTLKNTIRKRVLSLSIQIAWHSVSICKLWIFY